MDERGIVDTLDESDVAWSTDDYSEIDVTDADADFVLNGTETLQSSDSEASVEDNNFDQLSCSQNVNNHALEQDYRVGLGFDWVRIDSREEPTRHAPNIYNRAGNDHAAIWGNVNDTTFVNFTYNPSKEEVGTNPDIIETMVGASPLDFFSLFLDEEMLNLLTTETNRYAAQLLSTPLRPHSRLKDWKNTNNNEIKLFLAIIMWMGLAPLPTIAKYWKKILVTST